MSTVLTKEMITEALYSYMESKRIHDYSFFIKFSGHRGIRDPRAALEFAKCNLPESDYNRLQEKLFPFEPKCEDEVAEKKELYEKTLMFAEEFSHKRISFIYIMDELGVSLEKFHYMCKQLTYQYKALSVSRFKIIEDFCLDNRCFNTKENPLTVRLPLLKDEEVEMILNELKERNIALNDRSFMMMCDYYKKHMLPKKPSVRR